jgi:small subunit ribosomal protein S6
MEYELLFFTSVSNEVKADSIKKDIEEAITSSSGKLSGGWNDIGKRKFAHPIKKETHGFYSFIHFTIDEKDKLPEIGKRLALNDKIMRHIIVRADEIGKPSAPREKQKAPVSAQDMEVKPATEKKPVAEKEKADIGELDEKLNEILDENPE